MLFRAQAGESRKTAGVQRQAPITGAPAAARPTLPATFTNPARQPTEHGRQTTEHAKTTPENSVLCRSCPQSAIHCPLPGGLASLVAPACAGAGSARGKTGGLASLVATARGQTPDPIPNSAVKTLSADGTAAQAAEEQVAARLAKPPNTRPPTRPRPPH